MENKEDLTELRLGDTILHALEHAVDQKDIVIADILVSALEVAMTRNAGGKNFVERRDFPENIQTTMKRLKELKDNA